MCSQSHYVINVTKNGLFTKMVKNHERKGKKILNVDDFVFVNVFFTLHILVKNSSMPIENVNAVFYIHIFICTYVCMRTHVCVCISLK